MKSEERKQLFPSKPSIERQGMWIASIQKIQRGWEEEAERSAIHQEKQPNRIKQTVFCDPMFR